MGVFMQKKTIQQIYRNLNESLTDRRFLKKMSATKKAIQFLLKQQDWRAHIKFVIQSNDITCKNVLSVCLSTMKYLSPKEPPQGWLEYTYNYIRKGLFHDSVNIKIESMYERAVLFYLEVLRVFFFYEKNITPFQRTRDFQFATEEEIAESHYAQEYRRFRSCIKNQYFYELMRIGRELMPFDSLAHIAGVHYVAMHIARQLVKADVPIDLGLISGAAAGHDIGKYGCKDEEVKRIPYLHYYYTDLWCKMNLLPSIGHIAANHSTWDLELEDLPIESLVLIYSDFRVKAKGWKNGKEIMGFFSLEDSFQVILDKLDNVDSAKENRYRHVYAKLKDFEKYMIHLGVNVDFQTDQLTPKPKKDKAILNMAETVEALKYMAIEHNILLMHRLSHEISFGNILETARSSKNWKNSRAYLNIFEEYFTYMTQKQKTMTLSFLYELLMHREGDIRRQAADLMGNIIINYDEDYRKELPKDVTISLGEYTSQQLWQHYLEMIIQPDHKVTDRHKRWIGYTLKILIGSVLNRCCDGKRGKYLGYLLKFYENTNREEATLFIMLDSLLLVPLELIREEEMHTLLHFSKEATKTNSVEVWTAVLCFAKYITEQMPKKQHIAQHIQQIIESIPTENNFTLQFLIYKIAKNWKLQRCFKYCNLKTIYEDTSVVSEIFLENTKVATPWVIKSVNIELLLDRVKLDSKISVLQIATHFSNLVKVSERVTVRHSAGNAIVSIAPLLTLAQRNEIAIELTKGLEIGEYEFSKYIPQYLGEFALYLHPDELDEFINDLKRLLISTNDRVVCVTLDTLGVILQHYGVYESRFQERNEKYQERKKIIMGMILGGLANYSEAVNQEAVLIIGQSVFGSPLLSLNEKKEIFKMIRKKITTLLENKETSELSFFYNAASLNYIYRFIGDYLFSYKTFDFQEPDKIAFFPGTFDPFSLGHKEIAKEIRNMGFTVYLALDEFSWSKKTQPHMIRREIVTMSIANEENIYLFPNDIPINIANPEDLKQLKELFYGKEVYMVAGSDVVQNASSYKVPSVEHSIQTFNHILFLRESQRHTKEGEDDQLEGKISGSVLKLKLPVHLEDISSTRIRENIDDNRDISNLIDPVAQNYIYENSLYLREPQYKQILLAKTIQIELFDKLSNILQNELITFSYKHENQEGIRFAISRKEASFAILRDGEKNGEIVGVSIFCSLSTLKLYQEFKSTEVANTIRENTSGKILLVTGLYVSKKTSIRNPEQLLLTETLANALAKDYTYCVFSPEIGMITKKIYDVLQQQGFYKLQESLSERPVFVVDMKNPIAFIKNMETVIKEPFNRNERVLDILDQTHNKLQKAMTKLYPGNLVISFHSSIMHHRLVEMITKANGVPSEPLPVRKLGPAMCVPFGKILRGMVIPNTVTKVLHTEKTYESELKNFKITEYPNYSPLKNQTKTIKSFHRPVILVDDLLHKGYRIKELDPLFKAENIEIERIIVGILSGRGKDLMDIQNRKIESLYFIPSLHSWFVESSIYPFIGGDTVERKEKLKANLLNSINLILPYVMPAFLRGATKEAIYYLSMVSLENAKEIMTVLEEEYQKEYERNLTLNRLAEVIIRPSCPDKGGCLSYDYHLAPSVYIANDIEKLVRLRGLIE